MSLAFARIEGGAAVQQAAIVEHYQIAVAEAEADFEFGCLQQRIELTPCGIESLQFVGRQQRCEIQAWADMDGLEMTALVELQMRLPGDVLGIEILEQET